MNLSFAGCGFLGIYHVGVAVCFKKYAPHLLLEKIGGASAGALAACCLLCDLPLGEMTSDFFRVVNEARRHSLGPFSPSFNIQTSLFEGLQKHLPEDAHKRVSGRLHISLTRVYDGKNVIISQFTSRDDVLQALLCACFIPGFSGILPPRYHGVRYMDGAFSDNLPILDENTITVSPFCGESDICPRDQSSQLFHLNWANTSIEISRQNIHRFVRILFPPRAEYLSKFCQQGFDDALQFLHRNNLISCRRCVAVQSTFVVSQSVKDQQDFDPECRECKKHRTDALRGDMPQTVVDVIQGYLDQANKGLANWLFRHRGIKLISMPATVPIDFLLATISKITRVAPIIKQQIRCLVAMLLSQVNEVVQTKVFDKIKLGLIDMPEFDTMAGLQPNKLYGSKVSIMLDEYGSRFKESDVDTFEHFLKVATHHDAVYAYYYTDDSNKVNVTEIFDMTEQPIPTDMDDIFEDGTIHNKHQHYAVDSEWNGVESDLFLGLPTPNEYYTNAIIEKNNNNFLINNNSIINDYIKDDICIDEDNYSNNSQSGDNGSNYSDPEVDHYVAKENTKYSVSLMPILGQLKQQHSNNNEEIILDIDY